MNPCIRFLFALAALVSAAGCVTITPSRPGRFMSHDETLRRCGIGNYVFSIDRCPAEP